MTLSMQPDVQSFPFLLNLSLSTIHASLDIAIVENEMKSSDCCQLTEEINFNASNIRDVPPVGMMQLNPLLDRR